MHDYLTRILTAASASASAAAPATDPSVDGDNEANRSHLRKASERMQQWQACIEHRFPFSLVAGFRGGWADIKNPNATAECRCTASEVSMQEGGCLMIASIIIFLHLQHFIH